MASTAELAIILTAKDSASKVIEGLGQKLGGGLGAAGKVAGVALAGVATAGAGLAAVIGASVGAAADFEAAMSGVGAVAGATGDQMAQLSATALQLGQDSSLAGIGATDAAKAMAELAAAGVSVDDIIGGAARGALLLASAGGIDVARAAEIAANALNQFGLSGNQAGHVADLLAAAANASSADVGDLGESLKFVGPIAKSMGLSIEEVVATLAEFGAQGIKGSQAGTSLRSIISSLADPSEKAKNAIKDLNLQFFDQQGHMKSIAGISEELKTKLGGLNDQQRAQALSTLFGNEALSAATILYGEGAAGIAKYLAEVNQAGSAAATGAVRNDNLRGSVEQLKSAWETAQITLGQAFLPALRGLVDTAAQAVTASIPLIQAWGPRLVAGLTAAIAAVSGFGRSVGSALGAVIGAFRALLSGDINFSQFVGGIELMVTAILGQLGGLAKRAAPYLQQFLAAIGQFIAGAAPQVAAQFGQWAASFAGWITTTALPAVLTQLGLWQAGIVNWITTTALPAILPALTTLGLAFGTWVTTTAIPAVQTTLAGWALAVGTFITTTALPTIQTALTTLGTALGTWVTTVAIPAVQAAMPGWVTTIVTNIMSVIPVVQQFALALQTGIAGAIAVILPLAQQFGQVWQENLPAVIALGDQLKAVWADLGPLMSALAPIGAALAAVLGGLIAVQIGVLLGALGGLVAMFSGILPGAIQVASGTLTVIQGVIQAVTAVVSGMVATVSALLHGDWQGAWDAATEAARQFSAATTTVIQGAWDIIQGIFSAAIGAITGFVSGFVATVTGYFEGLHTAITGDTTDLKATLTSAWEGIKTAVTTAAENIKTTVTNGFNDAKTNAINAFNDAKTGVSNAMTELYNAVQGKVDAAVAILAGLPGRAAAAVGNLSSTLYQAGVDLVQGFINGINAKINDAIAAAGKLAGLISGGIGDALGIRSPSRVTMAFGHEIVNGLVKGMDDKQIDAEKKAADLASAIAKAITDTLAALSALAKFGGGPTGGQVSAFMASLSDFMEKFATAASDWEKDVLESAQRFAAAVKDSVGVLSVAVSGLMAIAQFEAPLGSAVSAFLASLSDFMEKFTTAAGAWETDVLDSAQRFAAAAKDAVGFLGQGVSGLMALGDFAAPAQSAVSAFLASLTDFLERFTTATSAFETDVLDAAGTFAAGAGKVVALIGGAVEGLTKLGAFVAPSQAAIDNFAIAVSAMVRKFADMASGMSQEGLEQAGLLGDAAGAVFGALKDALGVFTDLHDLVVPSAQAIDNFGVAVAYTVKRLGTFAEELGRGGLEQAGKFGDAVKEIFGALKSAMDILTNLGKFKDVASKAFDALLAGMQDAIERAQGMVSASKNLVLESEEYLANMTKAAANFAKGMALGGASPQQIGQNLGEGIAEGARDALDIGSPSKVMAQIGKEIVAGLVEGLDDKGRDAVKEAADLAKSIADALSAGVEAFTKLGRFVAPGTSAIYAFGKSLKLALNDLALIAEQVGPDLLKEAGDFGENAGKAVAVFGNGVEGIMSLANFVAPARNNIYEFGKTVKLIVADFAVAARSLGLETLNEAQAFGDAAQAIFTALKSGLDLFAQIDKPGNWPVTDWLQPLVELMRGVLSRGSLLLTQAQQLKQIADGFAANIAGAMGSFQVGGAALSGGINVGGGQGGGIVINNYYISGNTMLTRDSATQQQVANIVTTAQNRTISYPA